MTGQRSICQAAAVAFAQPVVGGWWVGKQRQKRLSIRVVNKDRLAPVALRSDAVDRTGEFDSPWAGHEGRLRRVEAKGKT